MNLFKKKMPENVKMAISEFVTEINNVLGSHVKEVILYGSYAHGNFNNLSDIDLMVLTDLSSSENSKLIYETNDMAFDIEMKYKVMLSPYFENYQEYYDNKDYLLFFDNVQREGRKLYA